MRLLFLVITAFLIGCDHPSQHDPSTYGTVRVATGASTNGVWDWRQDQRSDVESELPLLNALGPSWIVADEADADVVVRAGSLSSCGAYTRGYNYVVIDATCVHSPDELRRAVAHELMHWWTSSKHGWLGHVCIHSWDAPDCHPSILGDAVLNPDLLPADPGISFDEVYSPPVADPFPSSNDLALFAACQRGACQN